MEEVWKDIAGYEGLYQVSNLGNVKSLNWKRCGYAKNLTPKLLNSKRFCVQLSKNGNGYRWQYANQYNNSSETV